MNLPMNLVPMRCPRCGRNIGKRAEDNDKVVILRCLNCKLDIQYEGDSVVVIAKDRPMPRLTAMAN